LYWSIAAVSATGLLIGLRFRAPALIAATAVTLVACAFAFGADGVVGLRDIVSVLAIVLALQFAYLAGLFLAVVWSRSTPPTNKSG
jgi:hypothetical protein